MNIDLTTQEVYDILEALNVAIDDQRTLLPDHEARVLIDTYQSIADKLTDNL